MQEHRDDPLLQRLFGHELDLFLDEPFDLLVEGLDPVVRVDEPPKPLREFVEGEHVLGLLRPNRQLRVPRLPLRDERRHRGLAGGGVLLFGYGHEVVRRLGPVLRPDL